ncbi:Carbohydrate esterase family 4 protein [Mycena sanguinolenta]|uniref:Carbohydrate esterase family 4 protein n=1 Tax=Mycena sanguinolenta TaxID=230812 RepID=A0A8H6ZCT9_9AGAR|nr:Carbohydrate esterase family 4 protein [Mycena sanguinolenta]
MLKSIYTLVLASSLSVAQNMPKAAVYSGCTAPKTVALTFDDGPWIYQNVISDMLDSKGAKGTFFMNGNNYECIYGHPPVERLLKTFNSGHQICSHTWDHRDLVTLNATQIRAEADKMDSKEISTFTETFLDFYVAALFKILGVNTTFFRPPYGSYNDLVREVLSEKTFILWDLEQVMIHSNLHVHPDLRLAAPETLSVKHPSKARTSTMQLSAIAS